MTRENDLRRDWYAVYSAVGQMENDLRRMADRAVDALADIRKTLSGPEDDKFKVDCVAFIVTQVEKMFTRVGEDV